MTTKQLFELSEKRGYLYIPPKESKGIKSVSVCLPSGICGWTVDGRGLTRKEFRDRTSHEIGHCEKGAFYTRRAAPTTREKCEESARRWQYENMITREGLEKAFREGKTQPWELSDEFDLPEYLVIGALRYFSVVRA